ncbi:hypothetical protein AGRA3207_002672 [Actinomadura graeca]|uniref:Uncharacterized protein n=1 Tax=Actinomadura graeca TaxID=2750812 RepID=A0ABX8QT31_9ACTN|nr:hypothetical protein [Actinomadura graeca]QXJ21783.1 hypothetical protein AGRA3207_002672 [Actinomadura graeca]
MAAAGGIVALCLSFASFAVTALSASRPRPSLDTAQEWRAVLGTAVIWVFAAVVGVAVGALVRSGAGAITVLLVWTMLGESTIGFLPCVGGALEGWSPFTVVGGIADPGTGTRVPYGAAGGVAYALVVAAVALALALFAVRRTDP